MNDESTTHDLAAGAPISISCDDCDLQHTTACEDCLVSFVLGRDPDDAVVVDVEEARALRMLARAGLVPDLRHSGIVSDWSARDLVAG